MGEKFYFDNKKENSIYKSTKSSFSMESTKELVSSLVELGLNKYEARVYLALVTEGTSTAKNISDITGIPYGKVYEIINSLSGKGFCVTFPCKPMKCKANSPRSAIAKTKEEVTNKLQQLEDDISNSLEPMFEKTKQFSESKGFFWAINGRSNIIRKVQDLIKEAQKNIFVYTTENGLKRLSIYKEEFREAKERGVAVRIAGKITDQNSEDVQSLDFCDLRHVAKAPTHFFSFDGEKCLFVDAVPDDDSIIYGRDVGIWVINPAFTAFIDDVLLTKFNRAKAMKK